MSRSYFLGFDPGGVGSFGWAVAARDGSEPRPRIVASGCAPNAEVAVDASLKSVPDPEALVAAGIDAPLFWTATGIRRVDAMIRRAMHQRGALSPGGTVQQLNSLRGACLVQGVAAASLLKARFPGILVTETHPKALLWLLGLASPTKPVVEVGRADLVKLVVADFGTGSEHERDAIISCGAADAFHSRTFGWRDLLRHEPKPLFLLPGSVGYWMPLDDPTEPVYR